MNTPLTVLPFVVAFMAGLCAMPALNIFQVNAWNVGTLKLEPWRVRSSGAIQRAAASLAARLASLWNGRTAALVAALLLVALVLHASPAHAGPGLMLGLIVPSGSVREIREQREKLITDAGALMGANNTFENDDKRSQFDAMMKDEAILRTAIEDGERKEKLEAISRQTLPESQRQTPREGADAVAAEARDRALNLYLRGVAIGDMSGEERTALNASYRSFSADEQRQVQGAVERRDMGTVSAPAGGILVAPDTRFYGSIIQAMKFFGGMEKAGAEVIETDTAGDLPIPMGDDTGNVGAIVPEALASGHAGGTSPVLTSLVLHGYLYSSKVVKVSWQMLRDAAINVEGYVGGLLGERLARIQNTHFTATGTGSGMPQALTIIANVGKQSAVGNTTSIPFDDIYRVLHSVDVAYRTPKAGWMFHDTTALALRLAKDGQGRYLWPEMGNVQQGIPASLAGYGYTINNDMPVLAASAKHTSFGDHSYYKIRRIRGITIVRINELYVESGQVGFLAFQSADGGFADAGQHPVKLLQNSAT